MEDLLKEMAKRETFIKEMKKNKVTGFKKVSKAINMYYTNPDRALREMEEEKQQ